MLMLRCVHLGELPCPLPMPGSVGAVDPLRPLSPGGPPSQADGDTRRNTGCSQLSSPGVSSPSNHRSSQSTLAWVLPGCGGADLPGGIRRVLTVLCPPPSPLSRGAPVVGRSSLSRALPSLPSPLPPGVWGPRRIPAMSPAPWDPRPVLQDPLPGRLSAGIGAQPPPPGGPPTHRLLPDVPAEPFSLERGVGLSARRRWERRVPGGGGPRSAPA